MSLEMVINYVFFISPQYRRVVSPTLNVTPRVTVTLRGGKDAGRQTRRPARGAWALPLTSGAQSCGRPLQLPSYLGAVSENKQEEKPDPAGLLR